MEKKRGRKKKPNVSHETFGFSNLGRKRQKSRQNRKSRQAARFSVVDLALRRRISERSFEKEDKERRKRQSRAERGEITKRRSFCGFGTQEPSENNTFCKRNEATNPFFIKYSPKYKEYRAEEHRQAVGRFLRLRGSVPCGGVLQRSYIRAEALSA